MKGWVLLAACAVCVLLLDGLVGITSYFSNVSELAVKSVPLAVLYTLIMLGLTSGALLILRARSRWVVAVALVVFVVSTVFELSYARLNERGMTIELVGIAIKEIEFAGDAVKSYFDFWVALIAVAAVAFWGSCAWLVRRESRFGPLLGRRPLTALVLVMIVVAAGLHARFNGFRIYPTALRPTHNLLDFGLQIAFMQRRAEVEVTVIDRPVIARHVVLVVDESVRPAEVNSAETAPYIVSIRPRLIDFGVAASGATCSNHSNMLLNSFVRLRDVEDRVAVQRAQTIFYYAKKAGWHTALLMGQYRAPNHNGIRSSDLEYIDDIVVANNIGNGPKYRNDYVLLEELEKLYRKHADKKLFVFFLKQGCHLPYDKRYPSEETKFKPVLGTDPIGPETVDRVVNSYRNVIGWAVDGFYRQFDARLASHEAIYIYTSDHGQSFDFEKILLTHCGDLKAMAEVPLWIDARGAVRERLFARYGSAFATSNVGRASHFQVFPTLLSLMNIETVEPTLFDDLSEQIRFYCNGATAYTYSRYKFDR